MIAKPLVESQNVLDLSAFFPGSKAIWVYRDYHDVAASSFKKFGEEATRYNLKAVTDPDLSDHWYAENVSERTRQLVREICTDDRTIFDLNALAWYVRNVLYVEMELFDRPNVRLIKYETLVERPVVTVREIYRFLEFTYPGDSIVRNIHNRSVGKGRYAKLSNDIDALCADLLRRLNGAALKLQTPS